ncbi:MAG: PD-(D/E)XK nuclease family protein [Chloroflexi bacterium]|nr:PD-(D/E)XK nuclease family protein [Chloroflexota bacterium]
MSFRISAHAYGTDAERALEDAVARAKRANGGDPLAPVTILAPSFQAGLHLRQLLGRRSQGIVNVQARPLRALLELIGAGSLANQGRRPLHEAYRSEVIRSVAEAGPRQFGDLPIEGSVLRTLEHAFREFDECEDAQLDAIGAAGGMPKYLIERYREYLSRTKQFYTTRDLAVSATKALEEGAAVLRDIGSVIVHLPSDWTSAQMRFLDSLAATQEVEVVLGLSGDAETVDRHAIERWGLDPEDGAHVEPPLAQRVVQSPDAEEEVRSAIRSIAESMLSERPIPLHRTAILFREAQPYARICADQLDAAEIPWHGPNTRTLGQSIAGRVLGGLLNLIESPAPDWQADIAPWLSAGPILDQHGELAPTSRWNQLSRSANLRRTPSQWLDRLTQYRAARLEDVRRLDRSSDEEHPGRRPWIREELRQIDAYAEFVGLFVELTESLPAQGTWSGYAGMLRDALLRLLGDRTRFAGAGVGGDDDLELARWDDVIALLNSLEALDELGPTTPVRVAAVARGGLERPSGHHGRHGEGVYVGDLASAVGMGWEIIYVVGAAERSLPMTRGEDPLLSDELRARASLPVSGDRLRRERHSFLAALHAAEQRVISYPRADLRNQQARLPSRWLLESATQLNGGERVYASKISEVSADVVAATPSFERAVVASASAADCQEYDLRSIRAAREPLGHFLASKSPALGQGLAQQIARRSPVLSRWDGVIEGGTAEPASRPHSAGALQDWAVCPYRYFLGRVLRLEERTELRDDLQIAPVDKGSYIHGILDRFFRDSEDQPQPGERWTDADRSRLRAVAEDELDRAVQLGLTGRPLLWRRDRRNILADLDSLLTVDEQLRAQRQTYQVESELAFGMPGESRAMFELPLDDGGVLQLRGVIDRLDRSRDERLYLVIDYKTGAAYPTQGDLDLDPALRGAALQLPVYAHAVRRLFQLDDSVTVQSAYWFITERAGFAFNEVTWDASKDEQVSDTINLIMRYIRDGLFIARPGSDDRSRDNNCRFCSFDPICPVDRRARWRRVRNEPRLADYVALSSFQTGG